MSHGSMLLHAGINATCTGSALVAMRRSAFTLELLHRYKRLPPRKKQCQIPGSLQQLPEICVYCLCSTMPLLQYIHLQRWLCGQRRGLISLVCCCAALLLRCVYNTQVVTRTGFAQGLMQLAGRLPGFGLTDIVQSLYVDEEHPGEAQVYHRQTSNL